LQNNDCKTIVVSVTARSRLGTALYTVGKKTANCKIRLRNKAHRIYLFPNPKTSKVTGHSHANSGRKACDDFSGSGPFSTTRPDGLRSDPRKARAEPQEIRAGAAAGGRQPCGARALQNCVPTVPGIRAWPYSYYITWFRRKTLFSAGPNHVMNRFPVTICSGTRHHDSESPRHCFHVWR
jgi:hypothetical protein